MSDKREIPTLGCDPGSTSGALVLMRGTTVLDWCAWYLRRRKTGPQLVVYMGHHPKAREVDSLSHALDAFRHDVGLEAPDGYHLVVEKLFASPKNPQSSMPLAESAGAILGLYSIRAWSVQRVMATTWRKEVMGVGRLSATAAESAAVFRAPDAYTWPGNGWSDVAGCPKPVQGAVAEAACIAEWGMGHG